MPILLSEFQTIIILFVQSERHSPRLDDIDTSSTAALRQIPLEHRKSMQAQLSSCKV